MRLLTTKNTINNKKKQKRNHNHNQAAFPDFPGIVVALHVAFVPWQDYLLGADPDEKAERPSEIVPGRGTIGRPLATMLPSFAL